MEKQIEQEGRDPRKPVSSDKNVIELFRRCKKLGQKHQGKDHARWSENHHFISPTGDQYSPAERAWADRALYPALNINDAGRVILAASGKQITGRFQPRLEGREKEDQPISSVFTEAIRFIRQANLFDDIESDAFYDFLVQGVHAIHYPYSRSGHMPFDVPESIPIWDVFWDPSAKSPNLMDRNWAMTRKRLSKESFFSLFGDRDKAKAKRIFEDAKRNPGDGDFEFFDGGKVGFAGEAYHTESMTGAEPETSVVTVWEIEWKEIEERYLVDLPGMPSDVKKTLPPMVETSGVSVFQNFVVRMESISSIQQQNQQLQMALQEGQLDQATYDQIFVDIESYGPDSIYLTRESFEEFSLFFSQNANQVFDDYRVVDYNVYKYAFVAGDEVIHSGVRPENYWNILFLRGRSQKFRNAPNRFFGMVDRMKDPQKWANRAASLYIYLLSITGKGGYFYLDGTFDDEQDAQARIAQPGAMVKVNNFEGLKAIESGSMPSGALEGLMSTARDMVTKQGGFDPFSLGDVNDLKRTASSAVEQVTRASSLQLSSEFDALRLHKSESTKLMLLRLRRMSPSYKDLKSIVGPSLSRSIPSFINWDRVVGLDVVIDEQPTSPTSDRETQRAFVDTGFLQQTLGSPYEPPPEVVVSVMGSGLSYDVREKWLRSIKDKTGQSPGVTERLTSIEQQVQQILEALQGGPSEGSEPTEPGQEQ